MTLIRRYLGTLVVSAVAALGLAAVAAPAYADDNYPLFTITGTASTPKTQYPVTMTIGFLPTTQRCTADGGLTLGGCRIQVVNGNISNLIIANEPPHWIVSGGGAGHVDATNISISMSMRTQDGGTLKLSATFNSQTHMMSGFGSYTAARTNDQLTFPLQSLGG
jgi:hypothetical protein